MNLSFFLREVWRSLGRNAVPSFAAMASVLVTMLVLGAFIPVMQMASTAADQTRDRIYVSAFLTTDAKKADIERVRERILRHRSGGEAAVPDAAAGARRDDQG